MRCKFCSISLVAFWSCVGVRKEDVFQEFTVADEKNTSFHK